MAKRRWLHISFRFILVFAFAVLGTSLFSGNHVKAAIVVSQLVTSNGKAYIQVDGKPFVSLAVQFRVDRYIHQGGTIAGAASYFADAKNIGFNTITLPVPWAVIEPTQGTYDWTWIQNYVTDAYNNGLKVELMWYGSNVAGGAYQTLVPSWILNNPGTYQPHINSNGQVSTVGTNGFEGTGTAMSLADPDTLTQEKNAIQAMMNEIASIDTNHTVIGVQINNETMVNNYSSEADRSYDAQTTAAYNASGYTSGLSYAQYQVAKYQDALGQAIKMSNYSVYTRMNYWVGKPTASANLIQQYAPNIDFVGNDPYDSNPSSLSNNINPSTNTLSISENSPYSATPTLVLGALAAGAAHYDVYYLEWAQDDQSVSGALVDINHIWQANTQTIANSLLQLGKDGQDLATHVSGSNINYFHTMDTNSTDSESQNLGGIFPISYSTSTSAQGIAILNSNDILLMSTSGTSSFTITTSVLPDSVSNGYYDSNHNWVSTGSASYTNNGNGTIIVTVLNNQFIDLHYNSSLMPATIVDDSNTTGISYSGSWTHATPGSPYYNNTQSYSNTTNDYAQFTFTGTSVQWAGRKDNNRGIARVYLDGADKGTVDQYAGSGSSSLVLYDSGTLSSGTHTIKIVNTGAKNSSSSNYYIDLDDFQYTSSSANTVTASATSLSSSSPPSLAIDGNPGTGYVSADNPTFPQYLTIAYSQPQSLISLSISCAYCQGQGITSYNVQVTSDGTNWTTVGSSGTVSYAHNDGTIETSTVNFSTQPGKFGIRIQINSANMQWHHFTVNEMTPTVNTNTVTASATSQSSSNPPSLAIDGNQSTGYVSADYPTFPQYLTLTNSLPQSYSHLSISCWVCQGQGITNYNVQVSTDGTNWSTVGSSGTVSYAHNDGTIETSIVNFSTVSGILGIRIQINGANMQWNHFTVNEINAS